MTTISTQENNGSSEASDATAGDLSPSHCSVMVSELRKIGDSLDCAGFSAEAARMEDYADQLESGAEWEMVWTKIYDRYAHTGNDALVNRIRKVLPNTEITSHEGIKSH